MCTVYNLILGPDLAKWFYDGSIERNDKNSISQYLISKQFLQIINETNDIGMMVKRVKQMTIFDN